MSGVVTWAAVATAISLQIAIVGGVLRISGKVNERINKVQDDLSAHKVHVAETYSTQEAVSEAVNGLKRSIDRMTDRLDRLLQKDGG